MTAKRSQLRIGAILAVAAAAAFLAWLILKDDDGGGNSSRASADASGPVEVSASELSKLAASSNTPVYWAGERAGHKLEFTRTASGRAFVRYLPLLDASIGEPSAKFLSVGTYPAGNAYGAIQTVGREPGRDTSRIDGGGLLVTAKDSRRVHFSYPNAGYQVEVFWPSPGRPRQLVLDGKVEPVP